MAMRWAGPVAVELFTTGEEYRLCGTRLLGSILVSLWAAEPLFLQIAFVERRVSWLALCGGGGHCWHRPLYDVPFEDVLLRQTGMSNDRSWCTRLRVARHASGLCRARSILATGPSDIRAVMMVAIASLQGLS